VEGLAAGFGTDGVVAGGSGRGTVVGTGTGGFAAGMAGMTGLAGTTGLGGGGGGGTYFSPR